MTGLIQAHYTKQLSFVFSLIVSLLLTAQSTQTYDVAKEFYHLAQSCKTENKIDKALSYYRQALRINTNHFEAAFEAANMLYNNGRAQEALLFYKQALSINDNYPEVHYNLGICLVQLGQLDEACAAFKQATMLNKRYTKAYIQMATLYSQKKEYDRALEIYQDGISINPHDFDLHYRMGSVLRSLEQHDASIATFEKALELRPTSTHAMLELANTLHMVDEHDRSLALYQKVLEQNPSCTEALYNLGYTLKRCGNTKTIREHTEQALAVHNQVITLRPDYPLARFSLSLSHLTLGNFKEGWSEYEWRWQAYGETPKSFPQPMWEGQDLHNKRIFVYAEQGFGDTFQFVRFCKLLKDNGAYVIMQTQHHLKTIISMCSYCDEVISDREQIPAFDYHIALMSIPMVVKTTLETVPNEIPYLGAKKELIDEWQQKLAQDTKFKIGICWQGNKQYRNIFLKKEVASKAMELKTFAPLASVPNISLYSLQKINGEEQLAELDDLLQVHTFGPDFDETNGRFMDTAAIIKNLDLVITVDTSICHLAAGLGTETWVLLPFPSDWRWMLERTDTPWYPNMRLFRQQQRGEWENVMHEVTTALAKKLNTHKVQKAKAATKKKSTPSVFEQHTTQPRTQSAAQKELPTQLGAVVDTLTQRSIAIQNAQNPQKRYALIADHKLLQERYQPYMEQSDELKELTQQLVVLNKRLWQLEKELPEDRPTLFDESSISLIKEIHKLYTIKEMVVTRINEISQELKKNECLS